MEEMDGVETEWGEELHRDDPEKTSNNRIHLELLGEIIPTFLA